MKIAYLILAHDDPQQLLKLVNRLSLQDDWHIYIHLDQKSDIRKFEKVQTHPNVTMTVNRHSIFWGGWSMVEAMKELINASNDSFDRYIFMSGLDYPIQSNEKINQFFEAHSNEEFIKTVQLSGNKIKYFSNRTSYPWMLDDITSLKKIMNRIFAKLPFPLQSSYLKFNGNKYVIYGGTNFIAFTKEMFKYFSHQINGGELGMALDRRLKNTFAPDEIYFNTLAQYANLNHKFVVKGKLNTPGLVNVRNLHFFRYEGKYIKVWNNSKSDLEEIRKAKLNGDLFIRKVRSNVSNELIDMFDKNTL